MKEGADMIGGIQFRDAVISGFNRLAAESRHLNEINLFPIPDGDTGANMTVTMFMAVEKLRQMDALCSVSAVMKILADYTFRASRGNSGAILSVIFRGMYRSLGNNAEMTDTGAVMKAVLAGAQEARAAVSHPMEGTILTVSEKTARFGLRLAVHKPPLPESEIWHRISERSMKAVRETTAELPVLEEYGQVDSGALGFACFIEGMAQVLGSGRIYISSEDADLEKPYVFRKESVLKKDGSVPAVAYILSMALERGDGVTEERLKETLEGLSGPVAVFTDGQIMQVKLNTEMPEKVLSEAMRLCSLRSAYGYAHAVNFKLNIAGDHVLKDPLPAGTVIAECCSGKEKKKYLLRIIFLKDGAGKVNYPLPKGVIIEEENSEVLRCRFGTDHPAERIALQQTTEGGYIAEFAVTDLNQYT